MSCRLCCVLRQGRDQVTGLHAGSAASCNGVGSGYTISHQRALAAHAALGLAADAPSVGCRRCRILHLYRLRQCGPPLGFAAYGVAATGLKEKEKALSTRALRQHPGISGYKPVGSEGSPLA
jgi:hypothetical protein